MKKKNKRVVRYKSHINLNAGIVIFGLISIYLLINIVIYFTTERTAFYEVISGSNAQEANVSYNGIAIRNEIVQSARDSGYIDYYVREGSRVSLNTTLYSIDSTGELNTLLSEASKKNPKLSSDNIDTLAGLISDYCNNYDEMNYSEIYNFRTKPVCNRKRCGSSKTEWYQSKKNVLHGLLPVWYSLWRGRRNAGSTYQQCSSHRW